ncbi:MAG: ABC transporter ATP-binding protein, partial [Actinomyces sp.]|nr:ABC transporter ATP-binding protein [Actinomyces sp.]
DAEVARFLGVEKEELELAEQEGELWALVCGTVLSRGRGFSVVPVQLEPSSDAEPELMRVPFGHPIPSLGQRVQVRASRRTIH